MSARMEIKKSSQKSGAGQKGFTLLLAALTASLVLSLGASVFLIAKKEVTLSSLGRDSQFAFYTADQAAECALYWDARFAYFATTTPNNLIAPNDPLCDGQHWKNPIGGAAAPGGVVGGSRPNYPYWVDFEYSPTAGAASYCAIVRVYKCDGVITANGGNSFSCASAAGPVRTTVHADGYSTTCTTIASNPRTLQRSVELHY